MSIALSGLFKLRQRDGNYVLRFKRDEENVKTIKECYTTLNKKMHKLKNLLKMEGFGMDIYPAG